MSKPEVIVVGAGHNGLVCAAYLARAGVDVTVLEARDTVGGCASTVDAVGARVNICNCDHTLIRASGVIEELGLSDHGLRYIDLDPALLSVPADGSAPWFAFRDRERTLDSLRLTHPDQVEPYRRYLAAATPVARLVLDLTAGAPTTGHVLRAAASRRGTALPRLLAWSRMSADAVLRRFFTSDALLGTAIATGPTMWGLRPDTPGTGLAALGYATRHLVPVGRPVGGSGALPVALAAAVEAAGGRVRTGARVTALRCEGERVRGVSLSDGSIEEAPIVVSTADPRTTLVTWLAHPPPAATRAVARWRDAPSPAGYESKLDAVVACRPQYRRLDAGVVERLGVSETLTPTAVLTPGPSAIGLAHEESSRGRIAEHPVMLVNLPSVPDPTLGPADGGDVFSLEVLFTPYALAGGWASTDEPRRWLEVYAQHVEPGFLDSVRDWRLVGPEDYEREFNLVRGHAPSFSGGPVAALLGRAPELTRYRTPITGLYLSGAATFPGAGVWGVSGRNAARAVLAAR
jgi:phytoene dehydrogenase-like protein